ncbi:hypothetical protein [Timonella senegalensis]|uniref:hypothetical protein n=1 Tax=Timonella senegalensis TaxID=1465825 RepID=UPI002FDCF550
MNRKSLLVLVMGVLASTWVVFGRGIVGNLGSLTLIYVFLLGLPILVLHILVARAMARTAAAEHSTRPWTFIALVLAWVCFTMLGLLIPDRLDDGSLQTMLTGNTDPWTGFAIGIANPMGIIGIALCVASLIMAIADSRGPRLTEDELLDSQN